MASAFGSRYGQLGRKFLNDHFKSDKLNAKINTYRELISSPMTQDTTYNDWENQNGWQNLTKLKNGMQDKIIGVFSTHINQAGN
jgi:hypothetical protein